MEDNEPNEPATPFISVHTPVALLALALCVLFFTQIKGAGTASENLGWQTSNADNQILGLKRTIEVRNSLAMQSQQTQQQFSELMKEVDALARSGDKDAKGIIDQFQIKLNDPPAAPAPAAPKSQ